MKHIDLFSGIGGFALAIDNVFTNEKIEHIFCDNDPFAQAILEKHWPKATIHSDIYAFIADTKSAQQQQLAVERQPHKKISPADKTYILTGGFPCQPFSQAGRRKGTADDRYLWPPMLECIKLFKPEWIIAENVAGLASWNEGMVLERVCADLETQDYEVQPFVIPAVATGAPHQRNRIWIVAHTQHPKAGNAQRKGNDERASDRVARPNTDVANTDTGRIRRHQRPRLAETSIARSSWSRNWFEVATRLCRVDDGLPKRLDRASRFKALGNAIVPAVAEEIIKAIKAVNR